MADTAKCIDISHWQGFPDFAQVKAAGVIAMIHKCTEGTGYTDPNRARNCSNAIRAGIKVATYAWLKPNVDAAAQMKYYLDVLDPVPGERVCIDYEEDGCTVDQLVAAAKYLNADPRDLQVTVYSGHLLKQQLGNSRNAYLADNTDLWLAQYTNGTPTWPKATYPQWTLWQYSETGQLPGISGGAVDLNRFNGTDAELLRWISPAQAVPTPPVADDLVVQIDIEVPEGVQVKVRVNGA